VAKDQVPSNDDKTAPAAHEEPAVKDAKDRSLAQHKYGALVVVGIAVVLAFSAGMVIEHASRQNLTRPAGVGGFVMGERGQAGPRGFYNRRLNSSADNISRLSGVVTAVNGTTFTVGGNGATNSVQTTSSTQFTGGDKVAVNDSVIVSGTTNNGTFTATQVAINP